MISCVEASWFGRYESNNEHISLLLSMIKPCMSVLPGALPHGTSHCLGEDREVITLLDADLIGQQQIPAGPKAFQPLDVSI